MWSHIKSTIITKDNNMTIHALFILSSLFFVVNCSKGKSSDKIEKKKLEEMNTGPSAALPPTKEPLYIRDKNGNYKLTWEILREYDLDSKEVGKNLKQVLNRNISIIGFMMPLDYSLKNIKEFLLVPYFPRLRPCSSTTRKYDYQSRDE